MCGICGIIDYGYTNYVNEDVLRRMCKSMKHRGPDDEGIYINKSASVGLGHRRLKIIDLSQAGHQPMTNEDRTVWIVFNGEIYNYKNLQDELRSKGHVFRSHTDTEIAIHLYEEYGEDCLKYMRGMFAFALWDEKNQLLFAARDRVGKKPLLYHNNKGKFCFASEFESLLSSSLINKEIDFQSVHYYLTFGYIPAPLTIYKNVFKLPPAHFLLLRNGKVNLKRYWQLDYSKKINISEGEASDEIIRLLKEAVRVRLISDVPLGAFLSGGIDSSIVVGLMSQISSQRVKTFSVGFEDKDYNELSYARSVARRFNTDHHEFIVKSNALEILPLLIERYGEPYADSSCIPTFYVARETRQFVTVALNGDGGDELFAGYERYQAMLGAEIYQKLPRLLREALSKAIGILPDSVNPKDKLRRVKRLFEAINLPKGERYLRWVGMLDETLKNDLYSDYFSKAVFNFSPLKIIEPYLNDINNVILLDSLLYTDTMTYLPNDLLVKVDITSMANSLEARSPFLDHELMEFAARLPAGYKIKMFKKKYILKKSAKRLIPQGILARRKMGFGVPVGKWFRNELKGLLCDTLLSHSSFKRGYFKSEVIKGMVRRHILGQKDHTFALWSLLVLELWHRRFMD